MGIKNQYGRPSKDAPPELDDLKRMWKGFLVEAARGGRSDPEALQKKIQTYTEDLIDAVERIARYGTDKYSLRSWAEELRTFARRKDLTERYEQPADWEAEAERAKREAGEQRMRAESLQAEAKRYRVLLWESLHASQWLAQRMRDEDEACGGALFLSLQLLLGSLRAGNSGDSYREDLQCALLKGLQQAAAPHATTPYRVPAAPPVDWTVKNAEHDAHQIAMKLREALSPPYDARSLLLQLYLALLETEDHNLEGTLTGILKSCGIEAMYYDGAPEAVREDERNFHGSPDGTPYPALLYPAGDGWELLSSGTC